MVAVINFTLPAVQVVYHLLALGNVTNSVPAVAQSLPREQAATLPAGYVAYPDLGLAYKYHANGVSWIEANYHCIQEGARLAVFDTLEKAQSIRICETWLHAGVIRLGRNEPWVNVHTGLPVSSLAWQLKDGGNCGQLEGRIGNLIGYSCDNFVHFACEIPIRPILVDSAKATNQRA